MTAPPSLRLGYLVSQYPAVNHTFILREIRTLRSLGFDIRVVAIRTSDRPPERLSQEELDEHRQTFAVLGAGLGHVLGAHLRTLLARPFAYFSALGYAFRLAGWDAPRALAHTWYFAEAVVAGEFFIRAGIRHIHTQFSSTVALLVSHLFRLEFSARIHGSAEFEDVVGFNMAEKVARATFIATISRFGSSQTMLASHPQHWPKIHTLPLGVDPAAFSTRAPRAPDARGAFQILFVGTLTPPKGCHILLAATATLKHRGRKVELVLVGNGPEYASLEQAIASQGLQGTVQLAGACNHDRVVDFYRQTDIFALASFAEGVPVVLMEAMAMQIPCVAPWIAGIPELIRNGVDGLLVPPADPEALAAAIERLIDDPALYERIAASARQRVIENYDLARNSQALGEVFRRYLNA